MTSSFKRGLSSGMVSPFSPQNCHTMPRPSSTEFRPSLCPKNLYKPPGCGGGESEEAVRVSMRVNRLFSCASDCSPFCLYPAWMWITDGKSYLENYYTAELWTGGYPEAYWTMPEKSEGHLAVAPAPGAAVLLLNSMKKGWDYFITLT